MIKRVTIKYNDNSIFTKSFKVFEFIQQSPIEGKMIIDERAYWIPMDKVVEFKIES